MLRLKAIEIQRLSPNLIRHLLLWSETVADGRSDAEEDARILRVKAKIQATVDHALKHMDERETEEVDENG